MFAVNNTGNALAIKITGNRLDAKSAVDFKKNILELIDQGHTSLVLNLENVKFIDSSGLGAIVSSLKAIGRDGDLLVCNANHVVMDLFKLTRMDKVLKMYDTEQEALASF